MPIKRVQSIVVAFETAHKLGMRGERPLGITFRIVAGQALDILGHPGMHIGGKADGRVVHPQVIAVGAAPQNEPNADDDPKGFPGPNEAFLAKVPSFRRRSSLRFTPNDRARSRLMRISARPFCG
jgi:hypothetical protein